MPTLQIELVSSVHSPHLYEEHCFNVKPAFDSGQHDIKDVHVLFKPSVLMNFALVLPYGPPLTPHLLGF